MMVVNTNFYQQTSNDDLTYSGDDPIVWDRVNAERIRRGLPGLASIGYPRPAEEVNSTASTNSGNGGTYSFTGANNQVFEVRVPAGMSEADARSYFEKEFNAGKLTNLNIGQSLEGLSASAKSTLGQLAKLTNVPVGLPVNPAQILKQVPATTAIGSLDPKQVTGLLGQASSAVGQGTDGFSIDKGIGKFGLTPQQLQQQGFLKPGTIEQFIGKENVDFTSVLKSPGCWTGKGGAANLDGFLKNPNLQDTTQTALMSKGFDQLKSLGTITGKENPQQLAAMVQGAAKFGAADMAAWAKGAAPADLVASIDGLAKDAQFAADLTSKLPDPAPALEGVIDTVNRATVDNSVKGFVGNEKVPAPTYGPVEREEAQDTTRADEEKWQAAVEKWLARIDYYKERAQALVQKLIELEAKTPITQEGWNAVNTDFQNIRTEFNAERVQIENTYKNAFNALPRDLQDRFRSQYEAGLRTGRIVFDFLVYLRDRIRDDELLIGT